MKFELKTTGDWSYYYLPELEKAHIAHGFFTKKSPSHVLEGKERERFLETFGLNDAIIMNQEHGNEVHMIRDCEKPASGDGMVLIKKGTAGIIKTADCMPVMIADPGYPMVSIIHAGWRGTVKKIVQKAVHIMAELGAKKKHMTALLGPSIGSCCYEVGQDVYTAFLNEGFSGDVFHTKLHSIAHRGSDDEPTLPAAGQAQAYTEVRRGVQGGDNKDERLEATWYRKSGESLFLDISRANREILEYEGIKNIFDVNLCTFCNKDFFHSYRRGEVEKRQINFVSLME